MVSLDLSHNLVRYGEQFALLPQSLVVLNSKQNRLSQFGGGSEQQQQQQVLGGGHPLPQLRRVVLGQQSDEPSRRPIPDKCKRS